MKSGSFLVNVSLVVIVLGIVALAFLVVLAVCKWRGVSFAWTKSGLARVLPSYDLEGEPIRVLRVGGGNQSATYLDEDWAVPCGNYIRLYDLMFEAPVPIREVLMLGGGGYSYPKYLLTTHGDVRLDVVEYDPAITRVAWRHFYLERLVAYLSAEPTERLGLVAADGRSYLEGSRKRYDAILNDTFRGNRPVKSLSTLGAVRQYRRHLNPGGVYLSNVIAAFEGEGSQLLRDVVATLRRGFAHVQVVPCWDSGPTTVDNKLVIASDGELDLPQAHRGDLALGGHVLRD